MSRALRWRGGMALARAIAVAIGFATALAESALAQVSGSVALLSDYRFRGVSFSEGDPAAQLDVNYDTRSGAYVGTFASSVKFRGYAGLNRLVLPYAGYARRVGPDLALDAGVAYADFASGGDFNYAEAHAGVTFRSVNLQVAFAPRYLGQGTAIYVEAGGGTEVLPSLRLSGHVGVLRAQLATNSGGVVIQSDGRIGLRFERESLSVQVSRVMASRISVVYPGGPYGDRSAWVAQAAYVF